MPPASVPRRRALRWAGGLLAAWAAATIPDCEPAVPDAGRGRPFVWDQDELWSRLERVYAQERERDCDADAEPRFAALESDLDDLAARAPGPDDPAWDAFNTGFFSLAATVAACEGDVPRLAALRTRLRAAIKDLARRWPAGRASRDRMYRLLYGGRIAVEEVILQSPRSVGVALARGTDEPSGTPSARVHGVELHSGDLLLSRGGAPTSAFIARGNDYPGNFSHVALVHVSEHGTVSILEAHIERGVAVADVETYLADKKLRIALLRLRSDHPALAADPSLPHRAASAALAEARARHVPYDFAMDFRDHDAQFCSEVASAAYEPEGVRLWQRLSTFSSPGLARWMWRLGVRHLETQAPSDLEYDPQLRVVAEWRDPETLFDDHVDNAVIDAMLAQAEAGAEMQHAWATLPVARLAKAFSVVRNWMGEVGPVPEGMSATVALRVRWLSERHAEIKTRVLEALRARGVRDRPPPYWRLVEMAREASAQR